MKQHNELSRVVVTAEPKDLDGSPYTPTSARYKVTDCRTETEMVPWTSLTPSSSMEITIPGSVNTIEQDRNKRETKVVTLNTDNGLDTQHYAEYEYRILNLKFVE